MRRMEAVAAMVPPGSRVAEIGTDGAALARVLLRCGRAIHCIASDVAAPALAVARRHSARELAAGRLELRRGAGFSVLRESDAIDVGIVAGLGGRAIVRMLDQARAGCHVPRRLILQPQTEASQVRRRLWGEGLAIVEEALARERGRDYVVLVAEPREDAGRHWAGPLPLEDLLEVGPCLIRSPDPAVRRHWERELTRSERLLARGCGGRGAERARRRRDLALRVLECLDAGTDRRYRPPGRSDATL